MMKLRLEWKLILLYMVTIICSFTYAKVSTEELDKKEAAFDEIQMINKAADLITNHPFAKHVVEGDMMIKDLDPSLKAERRMVIRDDLKVWRTRAIPYVISSEVENATEAIKQALDQIQSKSCLKFAERKLEENFFHFVKKEGCWSSLGMQHGGQEISIGAQCDRKEIIQHLIMHSLGLVHEQNRKDRDEYISINWENINLDQRTNFMKANMEVLTSLAIPYDTKSLMHYGKTAFGDGRVTLESKKGPDEPLGNKEGVTDNDMKQLNTLYKCGKIPDAGYGPSKLWSTCEYDVKRNYRVCYGKECEKPNFNGIQHIRMKCDESQQAIMKGCYNHKPNSPVTLPLQEYASRIACALMHRQQQIPHVSAIAFTECMNNAKRSGMKIFGLSNVCKCHYGDDEADINKNGESVDCGDGQGSIPTAIYMYKISV